MKILLKAFFILVVLSTFAWGQEEVGSIKFLNFLEASRGLAPEEAEQFKGIFDENRIIDLQNSNLPVFSYWMDSLNDRLSKSVEQFGDQYPFYKTYVISSSEPTAYVYKYQPTGQRFYRGHVFLSTGLIQEMASNVGGKLTDLSLEQFDDLILGIQGVISHEFVHPKQDELIKWDIRKSANQSFQNHGQVDELTTDLLAVRILKDANLDPESMLKAIEQLNTHDKKQRVLLEAARDSLSSHPTLELRINVLRSALTFLRMEEGTSQIKKIPYEFEAFKAELEELLAFDSSVNIVKLEQHARGGSTFEALLRSLRKTIINISGGFRETNQKEFRTYLDYLDLMATYKSSELDSQEIKEFLNYLDDMDNHFAKELAERHWTIWSGSSGRGSTPRIQYTQARLLQRKYRKIDLFNHPAVHQWLQGKIEQNLWDFVNKEYHSDRLVAFLPQRLVDKVNLKILENLDDLKPTQQTTVLMKIWYESMTGNGDIEIEKRILDRLASISKDCFECREEFTSISENISSLNSPVIINERFVRVKAYNLELHEKLLESYANLFKVYYRSPELFKTTGFRSNHSFSHRIILWHEAPTSFLKGLDTATNRELEQLSKIITGAIKSEHWQEYLQEALTEGIKDKAALRKIPAFGEFLRVAYSKNFNSEILVNFTDEFLKFYNIDYELQNKNILEYLITQNIYQGNNQIFIADHIFTKLSEAGVDISELLLDPDYLKEMERHNVLTVAQRLNKKRILDEDIYLKVIMANSHIEKTSYNPSFTIHSKDVELLIWRKYRKEGVSGSEYIKKILQGSDLSHFDETGVAGDFQWKDSKDVIRAVKQTGMQYHPDYALTINHLRDVIIEELKYELGTTAKVGSEEFNTAFKNNFDKAYEFYRLIFNPDNKVLPHHYRKVLNYNNLDGLAEKLMSIVPNDLKFEQYYDLWINAASKRTSKHTEKFFDSHLKKTILENTNLKQYQHILTNGFISSDKTKIELLKEILKERVNILKSEKEIPNSKLNELIQEIISYVPDSSRFRDEYLEKIAWSLQLEEKQLHIFIEPLKSFNYKTVHQGFVNAMSSVTTLVEGLKNSEKMAFVQYVQNPTTSLFEVLPSLDKLVVNMARETRQSQIEIRAQFDRLENIIRDASENERMILIETFVGTRKKGLWFQGDEIRKELYKMANLEANYLKVFKSYLKALPKHEHSIVLSYMLASTNNGEGADLLRIMEMFQTPGVKFAQMASVFGLFGEEQSKLLAKAKSQAKSPTRASIYEILKQRLPLSEYKKIKSIDKLMGSGSIKYVVSVTFEDGKRAALYIRRPYIEETIQNTLDIAQAWVEELKRDPEFSESLDYDYYLESLREQLEEEIKFAQEAEFSMKMANKYENVASYKDWNFKGVRPQDHHFNSADIYYYDLVGEDPESKIVSFDELGEADKKIVSEYIVQTEYAHMFEEGDADRHLGNFLFDPKNKLIYCLDMGQYFHLSKSLLLDPGQRYHAAKLIHGLSLEDKEKATQMLFDAFNALKTSEEISPATSQALKKRFYHILNSNREMMEQVLSLLAELNKQKVRLPHSVSLGFIKGLSIIMNEDYAKVAGEEFVRNALERNVKKTIIKGATGNFLSKIINKVKDKIKPSSCADYLTP